MSIGQYFFNQSSTSRIEQLCPSTDLCLNTQKTMLIQQQIKERNTDDKAALKNIHGVLAINNSIIQYQWRLPFRSTRVHPGFQCDSCYSICSFICMFCRSLFVLFLLAIVLSVLLRYTYSDYLFGIFKLLSCHYNFSTS